MSHVSVPMVNNFERRPIGRREWPHHGVRSSLEPQAGGGGLTLECTSMNTDSQI